VVTLRRFPTGFAWGAATSAFQVEGAVDADGRAPSIWDTFSSLPGRVASGDTADVSADHYHRWREDIDLMASIGLTSYRFSIAWPRVVPEGRGTVNVAGLDFYDRLVDALLAAGIAPTPTLYHWDLPQALEDRGGWLERSTTDAFGEFAAACATRLGDRVGTWYTVNEPWVVATLGYRLGLHAPGITDLRATVRASHHLLLAHGRAVQAIRAAGATGAVGPALNLMPTYPATDHPTDDDLGAVRGSDGYTNRWFLDPILRGAYPEDTRALWERLTGPLDAEQPGDAEVIGQPIDVLGVNYYSRRLVRAGAGDVFPWTVVGGTPGTRRTDAGWEITPDSLTDLLVRVHADYPGIPMRITENGCVYLDRPRPDGRTTDARRSRFIRDHLVAAHRAIEAGVPLVGYDHWSLLDNFEWADGYRPRYGLVDVDLPTGRRLPKDSARYYASIIAANAVDPDAEPWGQTAGAGTMADDGGTADTIGTAAGSPALG
jgi:beta-glucosidase